jgi:hypothetical protein
MIEITLQDGTTLTDFDWDEISSDTLVNFMGTQRIVKLSWYPITKIKVTYDDLTTTLTPNKDERVYFGYKSIAQKVDNELKEHVIGCIVGIVRKGFIVEENFLSSVDNELHGLKINK